MRAESLKQSCIAHCHGSHKGLMHVMLAVPAALACVLNLSNKAALLIVMALIKG